MEWKDIVGFENRYSVSDTGLVWSNAQHRKPFMMKLHKASNGYMRVALNDRKNHGVHVLVAEAFLGPRPEGYHVLHWDGDKTNNVLANLRYGTAKENYQDSIRLNTAQGRWTPTTSPGKRLTPENVLNIIDMRAAGCSIPSIARDYEVGTSTVANLLRGNSWAWLTGLGGNNGDSNTEHS